MIQYFDKIENLGVFAKYRKPPNMNPFEKFNLIYGLNGSGKTTLSRFFADLNTGKAIGFEKLKYKITSTEGAFTDGYPYARTVRVFNSEYVEANIGQLEGKLNPIYVIGEENKSLAATVESDEKALAALEHFHAEKIAQLKKLETKRGKIFTEVAGEISKNTAGTVPRTYRKNNATVAYHALSISQILNVEELALASKIMKQQPMPKLNEFNLGEIELKSIKEPKSNFFTALDLLENHVVTILQKSAISIAISRLTEQPEIAKWVEDGLVIHSHNEDGICEYCHQVMPEKRAEDLGAHFNDSDRKLREEIEHAILDVNTLINIIKSSDLLNSKSFYPEMQESYSIIISELKALKKEILTHLKILTEALNQKLKRRTEGYSDSLAKYDSNTWLKTLKSANSIVLKHNSETDAFNARLQTGFTKIETHFLSSIIEVVTDVDKDIYTVETDVKRCIDGSATKETLGIEALKKRIIENRAKISNSHKAAVELSGMLSSFLGRTDLRFEPEGDGYRIMRFDRAAKRLSEGEKTAITFLYFVVGLKAQDFDIGEGIVVIDDPISSLDSSSVYQAFSFLKNAVKDARQVFVLTHNFEFLKLLLNWFQGMPKNVGGRTYWMLHCDGSGGAQRESIIKPLDKVLLENKNEFAYLLKLLVEFQSDGTIATAYPIPNIIRKVLETFLEQHSNGSNLYKKLEEIQFDETKNSALLKFANDLSHPTLSGLDPALVIETQTNIKHLLEMIKTIAPIHYKSLTSTIAA